MSKQFTKGAGSSSQTQSMMGMMGSQGIAMQLQADKCPVDLGYNPMMDQGMGGMGTGGSSMQGMGAGGSSMQGMGAGGSSMQGMGAGGSSMQGMGAGGSSMQGMGDDWRGKDCDNPFKPVTHPKCKYQDKQEEDYSQYEGLEKEEQMESKLECAYQKWKYNDERAKTNISKKILQDKRKAKMLPIIKQICHYYKPFCNTKDLMGIPKEPDERCVETMSCDDKWPDLQDIPDDIKYFSKLIFDIFDFSKLKDASDDETDKQKDKDDRREKAKELDKEMKALSIKYKNLSEEIPQQAKDAKCINKGRSQSPTSRNLEKNHTIYESMSRCFSSPEETIIKEYIKKRDEKVKIKPSFGRRLSRFKRTIQKKGREVYKSAKNLSNKKKTFTSDKKMKQMSADPAVRRQQTKDAKATKCKGRTNIKCITDYIEDRKKSGKVMDDFNKINMERKVDTSQQIDYLKNPDVKAKHAKQLDKFKTETKGFLELPEKDKLKILKKQELKIQQDGFKEHMKDPEVIKKRESLLHKEKKELNGLDLFGSKSKKLKKESNIDQRKLALAQEGVNVSDVTGEKKGKLNKAKFWKNNNLTKLEKTVDKTNKITQMDLERGIISANQAIQQKKDYASGKLKKEKGALTRYEKSNKIIKSGAFNSLSSVKRNEAIKALSNRDKLKKPQTWYGKTKKSNERNESTLRLLKAVGNNKGKVRKLNNVINMTKKGVFQERSDKKQILRNNMLSRESKHGPISNNRRRQIESNINDRFRGSNKLGFKKRASNREVETALKRKQANKLGIENAYNLKNTRSTLQKWMPFSSSPIDQAIKQKQNNISLGIS